MTIASRILLSLIFVFVGSKPCSADIIGFWDFETSAYSDSSGFGNDLSRSSSSTSIGLTPGVFGNAAVFNGSGFLYSSSITLTVGRSQFSTGAWVKSDQTQAGDAVIIGNFFNANSASSADFEAGLTLDFSDVWGYVGDGSNHVRTTAVPGFEINDGNWHHVAMTFDGSTMLLYFDGSMISSSLSTRATSDSADEFSIGGRSILRNTFVGAVDEAFFANHAMTPSEIANLASIVAVPEPSSLSMLIASGAIGLLVSRRRICRALQN